jgi:hypothetical protein
LNFDAPTEGISYRQLEHCTGSTIITAVQNVVMCCQVSHLAIKITLYQSEVHYSEVCVYVHVAEAAGINT